MKRKPSTSSTDVNGETRREFRDYFRAETEAQGGAL